MRIGGRFNLAAANRRCCTRRPDLRKLEGRRAACTGVGVGKDRFHRIAFVVVLKLAQSGHGKNAKACAHHGIIIAERTIGNAEARIEVAHVRLAKTSRHALLLIGDDLGARHRGRRRVSRIRSRRVSRNRRIASVNRLQECQHWTAQFAVQDVVENYGVCLRVKVGLLSVGIDKGGKEFPAQTEVDRQVVVYLPLVLPIKSILRTARVVARPSRRKVTGIGKT